MSEIVTKEDLKRVEEKLDAIIRHFNIGAVPRRSAKELEDLAKANVLRLTERRKKIKRKGHERETNFTGQISD